MQMTPNCFFPSPLRHPHACISKCLADISRWTTANPLKLNLDQTELLFIPEKDCPQMDLLVTIEDIAPTARNLGMVLDDQLSCNANITSMARSCRIALYNLRKIRPLLTHEAAQILVQALVITRLNFCKSLLAGLSTSAIQPLQRIQNAAARLVFKLPKFSHVTLLRDLHWLTGIARIRFKTMVLTGTATYASNLVIPKLILFIL